MNQQETNLVWSPVGSQIVKRCVSEGGIRLIIAPFIQRKALIHLLDQLSSHDDLKIITRWTAHDIVAGVSDLFVYEECANRQIPLYLHSTIHLKVYIMGSGLGFCGSSNVTGKGLGLHTDSNIEAGVWSSVAVGDWQHVYRIINDSCLVDSIIFDAAVKYREKYRHTVPPLPCFELPTSSAREFTLASLPATLNPEDLATYSPGPGSQMAHADINRIMHDIVVFGGNSDCGNEELLKTIGDGFCVQPFVRQIINQIKESGSLRFGEMTAWIHKHCLDVPVPYRWEVKEATHILYNWLAYFVPEISWSVPGKRSQVIKWKK